MPKPVGFIDQNEIRIAEILMTLADAELISQGRAAELYGEGLEHWRLVSAYLHRKRVKTNADV